MNKQQQSVDKIDEHYRRQLSALVDGELGSDQARFLLRRLQHDPELQACQERWSLLGDVMRGQAVAPAPADFAARVCAAVAESPAPDAAPRREARGGWRAWGGGAALAASVAVVALFMGRQTLDNVSPAAEAPTTVIASEATLAVPAPGPAPAPAEAALVAAAPAVALAAASRSQDASARRASATRTQQAARVSQRAEAPLRAVARQAPLTPTVPAGTQRDLLFGDVGHLQARPWPRAALAPSMSGNALNASLSSTGAGFYPFEPRLQDDAAERSSGD